MSLKRLINTPPWDWPESTRDEVYKVLRSREASAEDRLLAAEMAGDTTIVDDGLADALLDILRDRDEPEELRAKAAISFGPALQQTDEMPPDDVEDELISEAKFHELQEALRTLYENANVPREVRRRVLEASVRAQETWHEEAVRAAYASGDADWKLTAVFCMQYVPGFEAQILESLDSPDPLIRSHAVEAAGAWSVEDAWDRIDALASSSATPKGLRLAAIEALGTIRPEDSVIRLGTLLGSEDQEVADAAKEALSMAQGELDAAEPPPGDEFDEEDAELGGDDFEDDIDEDDLEAEDLLGADLDDDEDEDEIWEEDPDDDEE